MANEAVSYKVMFSIFAIVFLTVIGFFGVHFLNKLQEIEKTGLVTQTEVIKIQSSMMTRADVKEMIDERIKLFKFER